MDGSKVHFFLLIVPVMLLFIPFLLLQSRSEHSSVEAAALVAGSIALFMEGYTPWIMGALAGLPIFILVMISPILFVSGLVQIYMSSIWTLAYRDLKVMGAKGPGAHFSGRGVANPPDWVEADAAFRVQTEPLVSVIA